MWIILSILAGLLLIIYFHGNNAVWGGLTVGAVVGTILIIISVFSESGFDINFLGETMVIGTFVGYLFELTGKLIKKIKAKN